MIRPDFSLRSAFACFGVLLSASFVFGMAEPASAQARGGKTTQSAAPGGGQAVGMFGDWGVYVSRTGKSKVCYALSQPKTRLPKNLNRDPGYLFVSARPADGVRNEISWVLGFGAKPDGDASVEIDSTAAPVVTRGANAWLKDVSQEGQLVATMTRGSKLVLKLQSARGNRLSDEYSLRGFTQAIERVRKECP